METKKIIKGLIMYSLLKDAVFSRSYSNTLTLYPNNKFIVFIFVNGLSFFFSFFGFQAVFILFTFLKHSITLLCSKFNMYINITTTIVYTITKRIPCPSLDFCKIVSGIY